MTVYDYKDQINSSTLNRIFITPDNQKDLAADEQEDIAEMDRIDGEIIYDKLLEDPEWKEILDLEVTEFTTNILFVKTED